jgi:hypothetical protein
MMSEHYRKRPKARADASFGARQTSLMRRGSVLRVLCSQSLARGGQVASLRALVGWS